MKLPLTISTTIFFLIILISAPFFQIQTKQDGINRVLSDDFIETPDFQFIIIASGAFDNQVKKIDKDGNLIWTFTGHTNAVRAVAVDSHGFVYSASSDNTVRKIDPDGNQVWSFTGHTNIIEALAIDNYGNVYSGGRDNTVRKIDSDGNQVWSFTGHTNDVHGLTTDKDGNIYSASRDSTVRKISSAGNQIWSFNNHTNRVRNLYVDNQLNVYSVGDDNTVRKISSTGNQIWSFTGHNSSVWGIVVDNYGNVFSGALNGNLIKKSSNGNQIDLINISNSIRHIAIDSLNNIYVANESGVLKYDNQLNEIWSFEDHTQSVFAIDVYSEFIEGLKYYQIFENARTAEYSNVDGFMSLIYTLPTTTNRLYNSWLKFTTPTEWIPDSINPARVKDDDGNYRDITFTEIEDNWFFNLWGRIVRFIDGTN